MADLSSEAQHIKASGILGRSSAITQLFDYLVACAEEDRAPKESEIAHHVYGKSADFDSGQDALVRVHIHRLRSKIDQYYQNNPPAHGQRLVIPKGEYRLRLTALPSEATATSAPATAAPAPAQRNGWKLLALTLVALLLLLGGFLGWQWWAHHRDDPDNSPLWGEMRADERTILVIVGDDYLFGVRNPDGSLDHMIRDSDIFSTEALDEYRMYHPEVTGRYVNLDTHMLPVGVASAMRQILPMVMGPDPARRRMRVLPMSQVTTDMLRAASIV